MRKDRLPRMVFALLDGPLGGKNYLHGVAGGAHGTLVQFLMLTALRRNEAAELRRSEVVAGVVRLPPERVKNRVAFTLPLSGLALDILDSCPKGGEYFFPAKRDTSKPFTAWSHEKSKLNALLNIEHWVIHDLRRTAATLMERAGVLPHVIEATLNHTIPGVAGCIADTTSWRRRRPQWRGSPPCLRR